MFRIKFFQRVFKAILILLLILAIGVIGYMLLEDYSFLNALYMTVITISTVGFAEVKRLSSGGQVFTIFLIIGSFGIFAYILSSLTQAILSGDLNLFYKLYRIVNTIDKLEGHTIICGFGRNGRRAAHKLEAYKKSFVVIENDQSIIEKYLENKDIPYIVGDATDDEVLKSAGILKADSIITTLAKDADNVYVVISARTLNKKLTIISRASNESAESKLKAIGASSVVLPEGVGGAHMATLTVSPNIVEFLDHISVEGSSAINLEEVELHNLINEASVSKLHELEIRTKTGCTVIGLKTADGEYIINPSSDIELSSQTKLFVLGKPEEIKKLAAIISES